MGSLTGAVASQRVTEAREGPLGTVGNRPSECKSASGLDCENPRVEQVRKQALVIRRPRVGGPSLNG